MAIELAEPGVDRLSGAVAVLRQWQHDGGPMQLHPGDLGWFWRFGPEATAAALRTWSRDGRILALGLLDGPRLLRLTIAPDARQDTELAHRLVEDLKDLAHGALPAGEASVEAPADALVRDLLAEDGWSAGKSWTPLRHGLVPDLHRAA